MLGNANIASEIKSVPKHKNGVYIYKMLQEIFALNIWCIIVSNSKCNFHFIFISDIRTSPFIASH